MRIKKIYTNTPLNVNRVMKKWMLESARMWMSKRDGGRRKKRSEVIRRAEPMVAEFPMALSQIDIMVCVCVWANRLNLSECEFFAATLSASSMNVITFSSKWSQHFNSMDFQSFSSCRTQYYLILFYFYFPFHSVCTFSC